MTFLALFRVSYGYAYFTRHVNRTQNKYKVIYVVCEKFLFLIGSSVYWLGLYVLIVHTGYRTVGNMPDYIM